MTSTGSRSSRLSRLLAAAAVTTAALAVAVAFAVGPASAGTTRDNGDNASVSTTVRPPKGIPDLASMALTAADLGPAARVARQGYVKPSEGIVASYVREFRPGTARVGAKRLLFAESDIDLAPTVADARLFLELVPLGFALLDPDEIASSFREGGLRATYVRIGRPAALRVGDGGLSVTVRVGTKAGEIRFLLAFLRVNRVVATVAVMGLPRVKLVTGDAALLGRAVTRHMRDGLLPIATALPAISGTAQVGAALTASRGTWTNAPTGFAYRWQRCDAAGTACVDVPGAITTTYTPAAEDLGLTLRVGVTATNALGSATAFSAPTSPVLPAPGSPAIVSPPTISGTATVGQVLTADPGSWSGSPTAFRYAWQRCDAAGAGCAPIAGATAQTYTVAAADTGSTLRVAVTATNASGSAVSTSAQTAVVP